MPDDEWLAEVGKGKGLCLVMIGNSICFPRNFRQSSNTNLAAFIFGVRTIRREERRIYLQRHVIESFRPQLQKAARLYTL